MKTVFLLLGLLALCPSGRAQSDTAICITSDIPRFWEAFDRITATTDSTEQYRLINSLYIDRGTPGLRSIMEARRYTDTSYVELIRAYPQFWRSIRANTLRADSYAKDIEAGVDRFRVLYPALKRAKVYFAIGAFRTPGTAKDGAALIGAEMAMGDRSTVTSEFPPRLDFFKSYLQGDPIKELVFLNVHEYVHMQQKGIGGYDLLSQCVYEGIAEFIPTLALERPSPTPAIAYGAANDAHVKAIFSKEMFAYWYYNWIWNDTINPFGMRDVGYYVGHAIAERHYKQAADKQQAIRELVELDCGDQAVLERFVDGTGYFDAPLAQLRTAFEQRRPRITNMAPFANGSTDVDPAITHVTFTTSTPLDTNYRSTGLGELGKEHLPEIVSVGYGADSRSVTYEVKLHPGRRYQFVLEEGYRDTDAVQMVPHTVDFTTAGR